MIKLVCTDIDGTILKSDYTFSSEVKKCMQELTQKGVKVVLVTGRMHSAAKFIAKDLGLTTPVVSYQGGMIVEDETILYERNLPEQHACKIIDWARKNNAHLNLYTDDKLYVENDTYVVKKYAGERYTEYQIKSFDTLPKNRVHKLLAINFEDANLVTRWRDEMIETFPDLYIVKSTPYFCEFSNLEASKYCAVKFLQKYWNLKDEEILCIGDQDNDIKLLEAAGTKIAMGNASEGLKKVADFVTDTVENDGFVKAMRKYILGE